MAAKMSARVERCGCVAVYSFLRMVLPQPHLPTSIVPGVFPHAEYVLAFSSHCVFKAISPFSEGKCIQKFQLLSPHVCKPRYPNCYNPRNSHSCASMAEASGKRGETLNSNGTGRLQKPRSSRVPSTSRLLSETYITVGLLSTSFEGPPGVIPP